MKNFLDESKIINHFGAKFHTLKAFKILGIIILILICLAFVSIFPAFTSSLQRVDAVDTYLGENPYITFDIKTLISAHRAGGALAPENTLLAFKNCLENPDYTVDILEFDLHLTKDNKLILLHDDTLDRTSNSEEFFGKKKVYAKDKTLSELKQLNMGEKFKTANGATPYKGLRNGNIPSDCRIVTLDEVLDYCESKNPNLNYIIEIKDGGDIGRKATDILHNTLINRNLLSRSIIGTFEREITKYMDSKYSDFIRSASIGEVLLFFYRFLFNVDINKCDIGFEVLQVPDIALFKMGQSSFIDYCHTYDIAVQFWTINEQEQMTKLINAGADCIITDNPALAYKVVNDIN